MSKHLHENGGMKTNKENKIQQAGNAVQNDGGRRADWWESLSPGERKLICNLMRMLRGAKKSQLWDVARAAAKWERGIGCFIKVRLMNGYSAKGKRTFKRKHVFITVEPSDAQKN